MALSWLNKTFIHAIHIDTTSEYVHVRGHTLIEAEHLEKSVQN